MSQPRWSASEFAAIVDSHRELLNQVLNSPIDSVPPLTLPRQIESVSINCSEFKCSSIDIQNLFNHLDLIGRARTHNYTVTWLSWMAASPALSDRLGEPAIKVLLRFQDAEQTVTFDVHAYLAHDLRILGSSLLDPKTIFFLKRAYFSARPQ